MAKAKKSQTTVGGWKRKRWYNLVAPAVFNQVLLGETPASEESAIMGRSVTINLGNLIRDIKRQNINMTFEVTKVVGSNAYTIPKKFEVIPAAIRRIVRRDKTRIDDAFECQTSDNKTVMMKPFMITIAKTRGSQNSSIRKLSRELIKMAVKSMTYDVLLQELVSMKLQRALRENIQKVYPLKNCDIRMMELKKSGKVAEKKEVKEEEIKQEKQETTEVKVEEKKEEQKKEPAKKPAKKKTENTEKKEEQKTEETISE